MRGAPELPTRPHYSTRGAASGIGGARGHHSELYKWKLLAAMIWEIRPIDARRCQWYWRRSRSSLSVLLKGVANDSIEMSAPSSEHVVALCSPTDMLQPIACSSFRKVIINKASDNLHCSPAPVAASTR